MEPSLNQLLEFFQKLTANGASAKLFVETKNRKQVATLTLDLNVESSTDILQSTRIKEEKSSKTKPRKSPSTLKRDSKRLQDFRAKMNSSSSIPSSASTPKSSKTHQIQKPDFKESSPVLPKLACDSSDKPGDELNLISNTNTTKSEIALSTKYPNNEEVNKNDNLECVKDSWMDDLLEQFKDGIDRSFDRIIKREEEKVSEIHEALQELNSKLAQVNSPQKKSIPPENEGIEDESVTFEDVKLWALSQKKLN